MITVKSVYRLITTHPKCVHVTATKQEVLEVMMNGSPLIRAVYVVNDNNQLMGNITLYDILEVINVHLGYNPKEDIKTVNQVFKYSPHGTAEDIMKIPFYVKTETALEEALQIMVKQKLNEVPVVDDAGKVLGDLNAFELLKHIQINDEVDNFHSARY